MNDVTMVNGDMHTSSSTVKQTSSEEIWDARGREWFAAVADRLIPGDATMPSASQAGVADRLLKVVLSVRPDLRAGLVSAYESAAGANAAESVTLLESTCPEAWESLCLAVAGGYYLDGEVRRLLGYTGQQPRTLQIAEGIDEEMLARVMDRGPIYRDT